MERLNKKSSNDSSEEEFEKDYKNIINLIKSLPEEKMPSNFEAQLNKELKNVKFHPKIFRYFMHTETNTINAYKVLSYAASIFILIASIYYFSQFSIYNQNHLTKHYAKYFNAEVYSFTNSELKKIHKSATGTLDSHGFQSMGRNNLKTISSRFNWTATLTMGFTLNYLNSPEDKDKH